MKVIDIVLLIPILFGAYKGFEKGLIMEATQTLAFILAIVLGLKLVHVGVFYLEPYTGKIGGFLPVVSFALIFICTVILVKWIGKISQGLAKIVLLGTVDKLAGAIAAAFKWSFALSLLIWAGYSIGLAPNKDIMNSTVVYSTLLGIAPTILEKISLIAPFVKDIFEYIKAI